MKKLILLATGGTIASVAGENGLTPGISGAELLEKVNLPGVEITCRDVFALDSSNVQPENGGCCRGGFRAAQEADRVVITHGTDTMAYSAAGAVVYAARPAGAGGVYRFTIAHGTSFVRRAGESGGSGGDGTDRASGGVYHL